MSAVEYSLYCLFVLLLVFWVPVKFLNNMFIRFGLISNQKSYHWYSQGNHGTCPQFLRLKRGKLKNWQKFHSLLSLLNSRYIKHRMAPWCKSHNTAETTMLRRPYLNFSSMNSSNFSILALLMTQLSPLLQLLLSLPDLIMLTPFYMAFQLNTFVVSSAHKTPLRALSQVPASQTPAHPRLRDSIGSPSTLVSSSK